MCCSTDAAVAPCVGPCGPDLFVRQVHGWEGSVSSTLGMVSMGCTSAFGVSGNRWPWLTRSLACECRRRGSFCKLLCSDPSGGTRGIAEHNLLASQGLQTWAGQTSESPSGCSLPNQRGTVLAANPHSSTCQLAAVSKEAMVIALASPFLCRQPTTFTKNKKERKPKRVKKDFHYEVN